jgi:ATP-dependent DNA helicase PIF1
MSFNIFFLFFFILYTDDPKYFELLNRIRIAAPTEENIEKLKANVINIPENLNKTNEAAITLKRKIDNNEAYLCLCSTNEEVDAINDKMIEILKPELIYAEDKEKKRKTRNKRKPKKKKKTSETAGLEEVLTIGKGARVMLRKNLNTLKGYANGSLGLVTDMKHDSKGNITKILVEFDCDKNKPDRKPVTIERITAEYEIRKNAYVKRSQFPLTLAWAITIHKCQSLSLEGIIVDLGESVFENGMVYVALSRAKQLKNVLLLDFVPSKIKCNKSI